MNLAIVPSERLWTRNFGLYFTARIMSVLGDTMVPVALAVAMLGLGYGVSGIGYALGAWMGSFALFVVFGGVFADRFHPRPQMVGADVVRAVIQLGLAVWIAAGHTPLWFLIATSAAGGVATAMFQPGLTSLVPQVSTDVQKANGVLRVSQGLATMAGPAIGGILVAVTSPAVAFTVDAATFVISGLCLAALRLPTFTTDSSGTMLANLRVGWADFRSRTWLWSVILIWWVLGVFVFGPITPVGAVAIIGEHGKAAFGYAEAAFGAGSVAGALIAIRVRAARPLFAGGVAMVLFPLMPLAAAVTPPLPWLMLGYAISGLGWAFWGVQWSTTIQTQIPADRLNRVSAYEIAGSILAVPLGQVLSGPATHLLGVRNLLLLAAVMALGCAFALLLIAPIRRLTARGL
ncbi:MAG TPA: MFS transporter [Actinoplanes sp.]|nr:MFS transporter [Actinoplanes sp.]